MTVAQGAFLTGLTAIILVILGYTVVVLRSARTSDGGAHLSRAYLMRLARSPSERVELNRWAFYAHRLSGFGVLAFLVLHIVDVSLYTFSAGLYNEVHQLYATAPMRVFECALVFAVLFHTFNGLRLIIIDVADLGSRVATNLLIGITSVSLVLGLAASAVILEPLFT